GPNTASRSATTRTIWRMRSSWRPSEVLGQFRAPRPGGAGSRFGEGRAPPAARSRGGALVGSPDRVRGGSHERSTAGTRLPRGRPKGPDADRSPANACRRGPAHRGGARPRPAHPVGPHPARRFGPRARRGPHLVPGADPWRELRLSRRAAPPGRRARRLPGAPLCRRGPRAGAGSLTPPLPIDAVLPELIAALRSGPAAVLIAPTGAGKTTRVPPALRAAGIGGGRRIVMLEPRRIAARAAARRMAEENGWTLGREAGYQVRFDRRAGPETEILVVTEGILVQMLQADPFLEEAGVVIFDELHERNLQTDLSLAMARRVQREVRPDLKLVAMSATLDPGPLASFLGGCPTIESRGRLHPIDIAYLERPDERPLPSQVASAVRRVLGATAGDVLVFLPGAGEIQRSAEALAGLAAEQDLAVLPLYGDLPAERQDEVLRPLERRKVVLATNVAETSITIDGVTAVVDSGLVRRLRFDPATGLDRLELGRISRASADQRAGRAGRQASGACLRL